MPPIGESFGQLEFEILHYIAEHPSSTVREVSGHFANTTGQARTTILTVMERLRGKGHLRRRKIKGVHRYSARVSKPVLLDRLVGGFVTDVLGGAVSPFLAYLTRSKSLTPDEVRKLRSLLDGIRSREESQNEEAQS